MKVAETLAQDNGGHVPLIDNGQPSFKHLSQIKNFCEKTIQAAAQYTCENTTIEFTLFYRLNFSAQCRLSRNDFAIGISGTVGPQLLSLIKQTVKNGASYMQKFDCLEGCVVFPETEELLNDRKLYQPLENFNHQVIVDSALRIALDFIISHELAHILNGHLGWRQSEFGLNAIDEVDADDGEMSTEVFRSLEWDADCVGAQRCLLRALGAQLPDVNGLNSCEYTPLGFGAKKYLSLPPYGPCGTVQQCMYATAIGIAAAVHFFDKERKKLGYYRHPPAWFRIHTAYDTIYHSIASRINPNIFRSKELFLYYLGPFITGMLDVDRVWKRSGLETYHAEGHSKDTNARIAPLLDQYHQTWSNISPKLYNFKRCPSAWDAF